MSKIKMHSYQKLRKNSKVSRRKISCYRKKISNRDRLELITPLQMNGVGDAYSVGRIDYDFATGDLFEYDDNYLLVE